MKKNIFTSQLFRIGTSFGVALLFSLPALGDDSCKLINLRERQRFMEASGDSLDANQSHATRPYNACQTYDQYLGGKDQFLSKCDQAWTNTSASSNSILGKRQHVAGTAKASGISVQNQITMQKIDSTGATGNAAVASEAADLRQSISTSTNDLNDTSAQLDDEIRKLQTALDAAVQLGVWRTNIYAQKKNPNGSLTQSQLKQLDLVKAKTERLENQTFGHPETLKLSEFVCVLRNVIDELTLSQKRIQTTVAAWEPISNEASQIYEVTSTQSNALADAAAKLQGSSITGPTAEKPGSNITSDSNNSSGFSLSKLLNSSGDAASSAAASNPASTVGTGLLAASLAMSAAATIEALSAKHANNTQDPNNPNSTASTPAPTTFVSEFNNRPQISATSTFPSTAPAGSAAAASTINPASIGAINTLGSGVTDDSSGSSSLKDAIRGRLGSSTSASTTAAGSTAPAVEKLGEQQDLAKTKVSMQKGNIALGQQETEPTMANAPMGLASSETDASVRQMLEEMKNTFKAGSTDSDPSLEAGQDKQGRNIASANDAAFQKEVAAQNSAPLFERVHASLTKNLINGSIINGLKSKL